MSAIEELQIAIELVGDKDAAASLKNVDAAVEGVAQTSSRATQAMGGTAGGFFKVSDASKKAGLGMAQNVNLVTEMALGFGGLNPALRQFTVNMAGAGNNAFQLGSALGPMGVGFGLLIGLAPTIIDFFSDLSGGAEESTEALDRATKSLDDFISQYEEGLAAQARAQRFAMGVETESEAGGALAQARAAATEANRDLIRSWDEVGVSANAQNRLMRVLGGTVDSVRSQVENLVMAGEIRAESDEEGERQIERLVSAMTTYGSAVDAVSESEARLASAREDRVAGETEEADVAGEDERAAIARRGRGRKPKRDREQERINAAVNSALGGGENIDGNRIAATVEADELYLAELMGELDNTEEALQTFLGEHNRVFAEMLEANTANMDALDDKAAKLKEDSIKRFEEMRAAEVDWAGASRSSLDEVREAWEKLRETQEATGASMVSQNALMRASAKSTALEVSGAIGGDMRGAFESSMDAIMDGTKTGAEAFEEFAKSIIRSLVKRSIVEVATNLAEAVTSFARYDYAAGAQHLVAAGLWGAVGGVAAGVGVAAGAFGGGGGEAAREPSGVRDLPQDTERNQGPQNIVVNVGTFPLSTQADVGRAVQDALAAVDRRGG